MTFEEIREKLIKDERNREFTQAGQVPVYQMSEKACILIIGQAPGRKVMETGIPFNDQSGRKLMSWMGIDRDRFYSEQIAIMPMDFYYPGKGKTGDLPPRKFIAEEYHSRILSLMPDIRLTVLIGQYAQKYYLGSRCRKTLTETVRHFEDYLPDFFPIVHPSPLNFRWQAKNPWFGQDVVPALQEQIRQILSET